MDPRASALEVMRCDLCKTAVLQMHCDTCFVNLCKACVGEHILSNEFKDHKVVKFQLKKPTPLYPDCESHYKERCKIRRQLEMEYEDLSTDLTKHKKDRQRQFRMISKRHLSSGEDDYSMKTIQKSPEAEFSPPVKQLLNNPEPITTTR
ncbi:uncharacterized protein LOC134249964, partial [Saccostrea cucullata]|uniref:uncharacterized protein LOC134249964 n=1 Tax=Saccostrea cuccullata TaxID=36930 RepID=UPI002ED44936